MNDKIGPTDNDLLNYLSWCEATNTNPFGTDDQIDESNDEENDKVEDINILIKKRKDD